MGKVQGRYLPVSLPKLNLAIISLIWQCARIYSFCIQISCHSVFTENLYKNFVACHERFRIFPLLALNCRKSPYVSAIRSYFRDIGFTVDICPVPYEFQKGWKRDDENLQERLGENNDAHD